MLHVTCYIHVHVLRFSVLLYILAFTVHTTSAKMSSIKNIEHALCLNMMYTCMYVPHTCTVQVSTHSSIDLIPVAQLYLLQNKKSISMFHCLLYYVL